VRLFPRAARRVARPCKCVSAGQGNNFRRSNPHFAPRFWKGGALRAAEKLESAVILSIDSRLAAHDRRKLGPRKGSADLFFRSAAFPCPSGTSRFPRLSFSRPARAQDSSRGQRPRKVWPSTPDPAGVVLLWAAGGAMGVNPPGFDPYRVAPYLGACFPGALTPATV
jgi:hypothetical protein